MSDKTTIREIARLEDADAQRRFFLKHEIAEMLRTQSLEELKAAIEEFIEAETDEDMLRGFRFILRCRGSYMHYDKLSKQRWRESVWRRRWDDVK